MTLWGTVYSMWSFIFPNDQNSPENELWMTDTTIYIYIYDGLLIPHSSSLSSNKHWVLMVVAPSFHKPYDSMMLPFHTTNVVFSKVYIWFEKYIYKYLFKLIHWALCNIRVGVRLPYSAESYSQFELWVVCYVSLGLCRILWRKVG